MFANDRAVDDLQAREVVVDGRALDHVMDDGQLLEIFLAEVSSRWLNEFEQFANDLDDSIEMSWAHFTLHDEIKSVEVEGELRIHLFGGIHFISGRCKDKVNT